MDKKRLLEELSWNDENSFENNVEDLNQEKSQLLAHGKAQEALTGLGFIEKLDKKFDTLYKEVLNKDDDLQLFSAKVQRFELSGITKLIKEKQEEEEIGQSEYEELQKEIQKLFNTESSDILKLFQANTIHSNRKDLYGMYDEIADVNFIAYRMLRVYMDNILIKNTNTKGFLNIIENPDNKLLTKYDEKTKERFKKLIGLVISFFELQNKLKNQILPKTLKYGDYYAEVVDLSPIDSIMKHPEILTENITWNENDSKKRYNLKLAIFESNFRNKVSVEESFGDIDDVDYKLKKLENKIYEKGLFEENLTFLNRNHEEVDINEFLRLDFDKLDQIHLRLLEPSQVLKIEKDGILFGYLIIEDEKKESDEYKVNLYKRFLSDNEYGDESKDKIEHVADILTKQITDKIIETLRNHGMTFDELDDETKTSLRVIIYHKLSQQSKLKFRLVEPQDIANFHTFIDKFAPYATSIFDPIVQPVKMYTIGLMTSIISRLSRAAVVRKWNIEVGGKRNYQQIIEQVKKDLKNKSITFNDLTTIKNITRIMTDFRDIATITKNGQRFIDLEILPMHDRSLPIQELQDLRNELIMATGVPAVYLNSADTIDLRETLVNLNINFANTIITLQSFFEEALNDLINSIFRKLFLINGQEPPNVHVSQFFRVQFNPPLVLQLQSTEGLISSVANIIGVLNQAGIQIDPTMLLEKYIPSLDWKALRKSGERVTEEEVKKQIIQTMSQDQGAGGGL